MKHNVKQFNYLGHTITFDTTDGMMINATEMSRAFGKRPAKWLELPSTKEYINTLEAVRLSDRLIITVNGVGTWMHEDVAIEFARWLSPKFAIWCNDRIKELMKHGITGSKEAILDIIANPGNAIALLEALQRERKEKDTLHRKAILQSIELTKQAPKVQYVDSVLLSNNTYTFTQIAKELNMSSARALTSLLKAKGVIFRQSGQWMLKTRYSGKGFTKTRTYAYVDSKGKEATNIITVWTELGRAFLHKMVGYDRQAR